MLGSTAIKLNVKSHRSVGSLYKADHCESTNVNKQKLLNNRCARDECSAYALAQHVASYSLQIGYIGLDWPDREYAYTVKLRVGFPTFRGASYSKPYRVGIYTLLVELQTLGDAHKVGFTP